MKNPNYLKLVRWSDEDECFIGSIPDICGDCCHADTEIEVYEQLITIHDEWIQIFKEDNKPFPVARTKPMMELA